jgi:ribose transport system ATP-binding protein
MNILENASIVVWPKYSKHGLINFKLHREIFRDQVKSLRIKMIKETDNINNLSGGNQQKVILAKWLATNPKIMILDNPTQGVDVGAKEDIYDIIRNLADKGMGIIVLSSEAQEIVRLCDRAIVMYRGRIQGEVFKDTLNEHDIMKLATGSNMKSEVS